MPLLTHAARTAHSPLLRFIPSVSLFLLPCPCHLHGCFTGTPIEETSLICCKCNKEEEEGTNTDILYRDVELSMRAIYGQALGMKGPVTIELGNARDRLVKIKKAMETCEPGENLERMKQAVKAHDALIARLEGQLADLK